MTASDDVLVRVGRWALGKVWFGVVLSGGWALGRHFHWPQALLVAVALLGAVALALASSFLPVWTRERPSGIPVADIGLRLMVWAGLTGSVVALLIGMPAVGMVAAALLINTAARTFGDPFRPLLRRLRVTPPVSWPSPPSPGRPPHRAPVRHPRTGRRDVRGVRMPSDGAVRRDVRGVRVPSDGAGRRDVRSGRTTAAGMDRGRVAQ